MKFTRLFSVLFVAAATAFISSSCGDSVEKASDAKEDFYIFAFAGDELMTGRGGEKPMEPSPYDSHIFVYDQSGNWVPAKQPIFAEFDSEAKQGQGLAFARVLLTLNKKLKIGIVPCAVPGSMFADWQPGKKNFDTMAERVKKASADGVLKGILWIQGEHETSASAYKESFPKFLKGLRDKFGKELPVIVSQVKMDPLPNPQKAINTYLMDYARSEVDPLFYCCSIQEMNVGPDGKHYDTANVMKLDDRFFEGFFSLSGYSPFPPEEK